MASDGEVEDYLVAIAPSVPQLGSVSTAIWEDIAFNGLREAGDDGIDAVAVKLVNNDDASETIASTANGGVHTFPNVIPGNYYLQFDLPAGYVFTSPNQGNDESIDSDAGRVNGKTKGFSVSAGETVDRYSAGVSKNSDDDNIPDVLEPPGDRDNDGIDNIFDSDPSGYLYDEATGEVVPGGSISVSGPGAILITKGDDAATSDGFYEWFIDGTPGIYTMTVTPPPGYEFSTTCLSENPPNPPIDATSLTPDPFELGASKNEVTGNLFDADCADNPYYFNFDLAAGDTFILNNNIPLKKISQFTGIIGTPNACPVSTIDNQALAAGSPSFIYPNAGGGDRTLTVTKLSGVDSVGGSSAPINVINSANIVGGLWLGSDDLYSQKFANTGLDEETYELSFDDDVTQTQLTFAAINFNGNGDERIEIVRIEDGAGNNITSSTTFGFTDGTPAGFGALQFNSSTGRIEGSFYDPGDTNGTFGNSNGTLTIDRSAGLRKVVFKRIEIDNPSSSKVQPASNRTNGITLGPITYCGPAVDYGDAPDTYSSTAASGGPAHNIVSGLQLGTAPDSENDAAMPLDGSGDGAEDDGITLATLAEGDTSYTIPAGDIAATGTGTLHAWLDFDKNGTFEPGEYTSIGVTSGVPAGDLAWTGVTAGAAGDTYARFRFTSDASITANTPGGAASDGEVEDYLVAIAVSSNPNVVLVKRITAINGDRTQNPNDSTALNAVVNDGTANSADDESRWPANYLLGEINAGFVKPGDEIEYTVYFLNTGVNGAEDVRICDWIQPNQSVVTGLYGGNDIEFQLSEGAGSTTYNLTTANDVGDRAQLATVGTLPAGPTCNLPATATTPTDEVLVIDLTGTTGDPAGLTTILPGSARPAGATDNAFGFFRFTTKVDE